MKNILLVLGFLISINTLSQEPVFEHITTNDGLSNNLIRDILQDKEGYIWFATSSGLNRYDGRFFNIYRRTVGDTTGISNSRLKLISEDNNGFMWVIGSLGDIHRVNPLKKKVNNLHEDKILPEDIWVRRLIVTQAGDIWLILNQGVMRIYYPNETAKEFKYELFNTENNKLPGNIINFVFENNNKVWIGTNKGLVRITADKTNKNLIDSESFYANDNISFLSVNQIDENIYFGTADKELIVYNNANKKFNSIGKIETILQGNISCIQHNKDKLLLLGTDVGDVAVFNPKTQETTYFEHDERSDFNANYISEIFADAYGVFWMITDKRGIFQYNPNDKKITYFDLEAKNRNFLGEDDKQSFLEDSNGDIWIGINGGGLFLYQRETNTFIQYKHDQNNSGSISSDIVLSLYEDRSKNLWIGTSYGGVNKISLRKETLSLMKPVKNPKTDFDNYIRSVTVDIKGGIWVGSKGGKIYHYENNKITGTLPDDLFHRANFPVNNVYCLYFDSANNLWIGTKGNGIFVIKSLLEYANDLGNPNLQILHFKHIPNNPNSLSLNDIYSITEDIFGRFWIGSFLGGVNLLSNPFGDYKIEHFNASDPEGSRIISNQVRHLYFDVDNNLWIGTSEGVSILESKYLLATEKKFINLKPSLKDTEGLSGKVVYQIKQTKNKDIFLAMLDGSVNQLKAADFENLDFKWIHHNNQVLSPNVYSMEEDENGNLWMGTDIGLCRINSNDGLVDRYRINNNFLPLKFSESCSHKSLKNELVFGTNKGFVHFQPNSIKKDTAEFPLKFSRLEINGEHITNLNSSVLSTAIEAQDHLQLQHSQNNLTLYFTVLGFNNSDAIQYSYILEGYDEFWSKPSTLGHASYRKLPPGEYVLKAKGTNSSGTWMKQNIALSIEITAQFWKSKLGYSIIGFFILSIITLFFILIRKQIVIKNKARVEKSITEKRIEYYTNISHEFKTPLSLILNPVEELIQSHKSSDFARQKGMQIKKNATYLKRLIDQILDFRKIREGKMQLKVNEIDLFEFFREIYLVFLPLANKLNIVFDYKCNSENAKGFVDIKQLEKITYNLLSNALRFTPSGKAVTLIVEINSAKKDIEIRIEDEGEGIDEKELEKIFDRFYNSKSSSGIGLFFTREMVLLHHGEIDAFNGKNGGAIFRVRIPIVKDAYTNEEIDIQNVNQISFNLPPVDDIETIVSSSSIAQNIHRHNADYIQSILIVEDNDEMRNYLCSELSDTFKIYEANNGLKGIELAKKHLPSLILSDALMPEMNGFELTQTLKENFDTSHIPIIILSGQSSEEKQLLGINSGADDYITKPFNLNFLEAKIKKLITERKKLRDRFERDAKIQDGLKENVSREMLFINSVQEMIQQNLSNSSLNVDFLVQKMGISRTLFFKRMKSAKGFAPNEFIRIIRMKEAAQLLVTTDKTISEISDLVGYTDSNYFTKTFKKHYGKTPSEFKLEKNRNNYL